MEYSYLGKTGLKVSRLCMGTMNFSWTTNEEDSFKILDAALDAGINFIDCADVYGGNNICGLTEELLGKWFAQGGGRRERTILTSKAYIARGDKLEGVNDENGLSAYKIKRHVEGSLRRLNTDHIELYYMHHVDPHTPWAEIWGAFENLIAQGKIDYIGSSNFGARHLCYAQENAKERHFLGLVAEQCQYNLLHRLPEVELLPTARELGIGILPWSPLGGGMLSGHYLQRIDEARGPVTDDKVTEQLRRQLTEYSTVCKELGETEADVAIAWLLSNPAVTAPVIGPRSMEQFQSMLHAAEIKLPEDFIQKLNEIFPGYKEGPQAYAW